MHDRISVNSICFLNESFAQQLNYWQRLGAKRISFVGPQLDEQGEQVVQAIIDSGQFKLETIVHPLMSGQALNPDEKTWELPRKALSDRIALAQRWGSRSIYMTTGGHGDMTWEHAAETFAAVIAPCVEQAKTAGIQLMIENASPLYADLHIAHSLRDTITLAEMSGIGVCIDLFGCWTEAGLQASIERAVPMCHLVQVSDYVVGDRSLPSRAVPGDGNMPLARLLQWLLAAGYQGVFDLELIGPRIDEEGAVQATSRAGQYLGDLLDKLVLR